MPRIDQIRFSVTRADSSEAENWRVDEGTSISEILNDELCVNPSKFTVFVNGGEVTDLSRTVREGDQLSLQPKNYSSGLNA